MIYYGTAKTPEGETSVALGTFDGIHRGHFNVIKSAVDGSKRGLIPCVVSFFPHPQKVLSGKAPPTLLTVSQREIVHASIGVKLCYLLDFEQIASLSPREFVKDILVDKLRVREISCGYDYRFGKGGAGNPQVLAEICDELGIKLSVVDRVDLCGERISSTAIRRAIEDGDVMRANRMLGRPFCYDFIVVGGNKNGRTIGFPTINQYFPDGFVLPKFGVYASRTFVDGWWKPSITTFGVKPTVGSDRPVSETCILDYSGDLYGEEVWVQLLDFIRPERKFASLEELREQIKTDTVKAAECNALKAVIFDFDDTLSDRKVGFIDYAKYFLRKYFPEMPQEELEQRAEDMHTRNNGGYHDRELFFTEIIRDYGMKNPPSLEELYEEYDTVFPQMTQLFPETLDTLRALKSKGLKIGIVTNGVSVMQHNKLRVTGIDAIADAVVVSGDLPFKKPSVEIFDYVAEKLGVRNDQTIFIGDHPRNDISGARKAGMNVVWMRHGFFKDEVMEDTASIEKISEILDFI